MCMAAYMYQMNAVTLQLRMKVPPQVFTCGHMHLESVSLKCTHKDGCQHATLFLSTSALIVPPGSYPVQADALPATEVSE